MMLKMPPCKSAGIEKGVSNMRVELINKVLEQIKKDLEAGDVTALEVLLGEVSEKNLRSYLPEAEAT